MQNVIISARFEGLVGKCMLGPWRPREVLENIFFHLGSQIE